MKTPEQIAQDVYWTLSDFPLEPKGNALRALMAQAIKADRVQREPLYAIVQGGMIQDSSAGIECIDLDWLDSGDSDDIEDDELERQACILRQAIDEGGKWQGELAEIEDILSDRAGRVES